LEQRTHKIKNKTDFYRTKIESQCDFLTTQKYGKKNGKDLYSGRTSECIHVSAGKQRGSLWFVGVWSFSSAFTLELTTRSAQVYLQTRTQQTSV
jgi:hypothetical protein